MAVHDRLEEARTDEAPRHAAQADEDAARADGVHLRHEALVGAEREAEHEAALERKACTSKKRYPYRSDAEEAIELCAQHGTRGLHCYRCPYCDGWHLTSKPMRD